MQVVEYKEHIAALASEIETLRQSIAAGPVSSPVPTCPEWTMVDLTEHVGHFCGFWAHVLCEGSGRPKPMLADKPGEDPASWFATAGHHLVEELSATAPRTEVWTWYDADKSAAFVARRSAHELAVHRYDAQSSRGSCQPIDARLAADGIDEVLVTLVEARDRTGEATGQTMGIVADDIGTGWLVTLEPDRITVSRSDVDGSGMSDQELDVATAGDLVLRGAASDLELALYGRATLGPVERSGADAVFEAWRGEFLF